MSPDGVGVRPRLLGGQGRFALAGTAPLGALGENDSEYLLTENA